MDTMYDEVKCTNKTQKLMNNDIIYNTNSEHETNKGTLKKNIIPNIYKKNALPLG